MKAEERHELRENDLASWLQYGLWGFLRQNGSYILLVLALAFLGYTLWKRHEQSKVDERNAAFIDFNNAVTDQNELPSTDPKGESYKALQLLPEMVESSPYPEIKVQAALELAKVYNRIASDLYSQEQTKITHADALSKAYDMYTKVLELRGDDPLLAGKAHLGIAAIYEDQGEWDKAAAEYKKITDDHKFDGPVHDLAKSLADGLDARHNAPRLAAYRPPLPSNPISPIQSSVPGNGVLPLTPGGSGSFQLPFGPQYTPPGMGPGSGLISPGMGISSFPLSTAPATQSAPIVPESSTQPK